jgi:hypothetical protein
LNLTANLKEITFQAFFPPITSRLEVPPPGFVAILPRCFGEDVRSSLMRV